MADIKDRAREYIAELESQIEKMKCCNNCALYQYEKWNSGEVNYHYEKYDKWEIKEK